MNPDSSLGEDSLLFSPFFESNMHKPHQDGHANTPSVTLIRQVTVQDQAAHITPAPNRPELLRRDPRPQAQNNACDQSVQAASQSASEAARQASQSASQSIQQAQQQASDAVRQAGQSASQGIQSAQQQAQQASQAIAQASRSADQAVSSASSAVASAQSSASQALSAMQGSMDNIRSSASSVQAGASAAVLQAGAAVAAATGSAAAAGSSFLAAAAKATQVVAASAAASVSAVGAAAASSINNANQQISASQSAAVTATQAALAIVGSIIASALITILIYFLIIRHQKKAKQKKEAKMSQDMDYSSDPKFPISDQVGTTIAASQSAYNATRDMPGTRDAAQSESDISLSQFPATPSNPSGGNNALKSTSLAWNPSNPPQPPKLGGWLKVEETVVSPFGSIKLPTDNESKSPLGGQLKSPLQSNYRAQSKFEPPPSSAFRSPNSMGRDSKQSVFEIGKATVQQAMIRSVTISKPQSKRNPVPAEAPGPGPAAALLQPSSAKGTPMRSTSEMPFSANKIPAYRESKASVWTDEVPDSGPSPYLPSPPGRKNAASTLDPSYMDLPMPKNPVRTTAEWLSTIRDAAEAQNGIGGTRESVGTNGRESRSKSSGLPNNPRSIGMGMGGPRSTIGTPSGLSREERDEQVKSVTGEIGYVNGLGQFFPQGNGLERAGSNSSTGSRSSGSRGSLRGRGNFRGRGGSGMDVMTPGVGRAM